MVSLQFKAAYAILPQVAAYLFCVFRCPSSAAQLSTSASYSVATRLQAFRLRGQSRLLPCGSSQFHRDADLASPVLFRADSQPVNQLLRYASRCFPVLFLLLVQSNQVHSRFGSFPLPFPPVHFRFRAHRCRSGSVRSTSQHSRKSGPFHSPSALFSSLPFPGVSALAPCHFPSPQVKSNPSLADALPGHIWVFPFPCCSVPVQSLPAHCFPGRSHSLAVLHGASPLLRASEQFHCRSGLQPCWYLQFRCSASRCSAYPFWFCTLRWNSIAALR